MAREKLETQHSGFPPPLPLGYDVPATDGDGEELPDSISEALLANAIKNGASIRRAVVVEMATTHDYLLYVRLSDRAGYNSVAKRRPKDGPKAWQDFRTLKRALHNHSYCGPVYVFPEGHPFLTRIGLDAEAHS